MAIASSLAGAFARSFAALTRHASRSDYPVVRLGMGAFSTSCSAVYAAATGLKLPFTQYGKPHRPTYEFADAMLHRRADELRGPGAEKLNV